MIKTAAVNLKSTLKPGVYNAARRISKHPGGFRIPLGVHRYLILIPKDPSKFEGKLTDLGNGQQGVIVGAKNVKRTLEGPRELRYHRNATNDLLSAKELLKHKAEGKGHWQTSIRRIVRNQGDYADAEISEILQKARAFREATDKKLQEYPGVVSTLLDTGRNSNTFIASLLDYSGHGAKEKKMNTPGFDSGSDLRFDKEMFGADKTAADVLGLNKEAFDFEDLKASFKKTDPRIWSTPVGMAAGMALMHAMGDPGKRSKFRYLMAGGAGAGLGYAAGSGLKTHMPEFSEERNKGMAEMTDVASGAKELSPEIKRIVLDLKGKGYDDGAEHVENWIRQNPQSLLDDSMPEEYDKIEQWMKATKDPAGKNMYENQIQSGSWIPFMDTPVETLTRAGFSNPVTKGDFDKHYATKNRARLKHGLAGMARQSIGTDVDDKTRGNVLALLNKAVRVNDLRTADSDPDSHLFGMVGKRNKNILKGIATTPFTQMARLSGLGENVLNLFREGEGTDYFDMNRESK